MGTELHGFYQNMPYENYAAFPALNGSKLVHMRRSPMKYKFEIDTPTPCSPAMELGKIVHQLILEPESVGNIAVWGAENGQKVRRGKVWDSFRKAHEGEIILSVPEFDEVWGMAKSALNNVPIRKYSEASGETEVSLFWRHPFTKRRYKARLDKIIADTHTIFDLKTTRDCHSHKFGAQAYNLGYHMKLGLYFQGYRELTGIEPKVVMGAVDSKAPHESAVYRVPKDVVLQGIEELDLLVAKITDCEKSNIWPGEYDEETDLVLPTWAMGDEYAIGDVA